MIKNALEHALEKEGILRCDRSLWDSKIRLGEDFFNEIISHPLAWPDLNYATAKGVLILSPSTPRISPKHLERRE